MIRSEQEKRDKKIIEAYLNGESVRMLAATKGLSTQRIHQILDKYGIEKRNALDK